MKKIGEKAFDMQDPTKKTKRVSAEHIQFMYPAEYYLTTLSQKEIFGRTAKYINHPDLMPDLYKDLEETELNKTEADHSGVQKDPTNPNNVIHYYNLHSRMAHRLKLDCEYGKTFRELKSKWKSFEVRSKITVKENRGMYLLIKWNS